MKKTEVLNLSDHLCADQVKIGLSVADREEALTILTQEAESAGLVRDHRIFLTQLRTREAEITTAVGRGLAVPHVEVVGAKATFVISATLASPIDYQAFDHEPVDVIFLIGGKPGEIGIHLQLLARIARMARQPEFLARLRAQKAAKDFIAVVAEAEKQLYSSDQ